MPTNGHRHTLLGQGSRFVAAGVAQLLLDWFVFVVTTAAGLPAASGNVAGRACGALLGFWLNGRVTFAAHGQSRLGWRRFLRFLALWLLLTAASTWLVSAIAGQLGLQFAWLAKPVVEGALAVLSFFLLRHVVYR